MPEVMDNIEPGTHQKEQEVAYQTIKQIAADNEHNGKLDILRIKNSVELAVGISYIHVKKCIKPNNITKKYIDKKTAQKTNKKAAPFPSHKSEGRSEHNEQIRNNSSECKGLKHRTLQEKTYKY